MPYNSKRERKRQQEEKERARRVHFMDAVKYVQEKEACTDESAAEQLIAAIIDRAIAAEWGDGQPISPSEFSGTLRLCLDGVGFVKRNDEPIAKAKSVAGWTTNYPKLEFVKGPVTDALRSDAPLSEVNNLDYIPLLVSKADLDRWPLEDSSTKVAQTADVARKRRPPVSKKEIRRVARSFYSDPSNPPNLMTAEQLVGGKLPDAARVRIRSVLKEDEFAGKRRKPGRQPKSPAVSSRPVR